MIFFTEKLLLFEFEITLHIITLVSLTIFNKIINLA